MQLSVLAVLFAICGAQQPAAHVVELIKTDGVRAEALMPVFESMGVSAQQAAPLLQAIDAKGKQIIIQGPAQACTKAAEAFKAVGMSAIARAMTKADKPSEYSDSDVIEADAAELQQLVDDPAGGTLVTFYAPWCGHCVKMVPEFKKAASLLKKVGIKAAAVNSDDNPGLAKSLGIQGFPTVRWVYAGQWTDYKAQRTSMEMVQWATQQAAVSKIKKVVGGVVKGSKMAMSKVLGRVAGGMGTAVAPLQGQEAAAPA